MTRRRPRGGELFIIVLLTSVAMDVAVSVWIDQDLLKVGWFWSNELISAVSIALACLTLAAACVLGYRSREAFKLATTPGRKVTYILRTGLYKYVRHPFYFSLILAGVSFFLLRRSYALLAGSIGVAVVLVAEAREEELVLVERFGEEYQAYRQSTGMFLPRIPRRDSDDG